MLFRKERFDRVTIINAETASSLSTKIEELARTYIIVDMQFSVNANNFYGLVLYRHPEGV